MNFTWLDSVYCADHLYIFFIGIIIIVYIKISKIDQNIYKKLWKKYLYLSTFYQIAEQREFKFPLSLHENTLLNYY